MFTSKNKNCLDVYENWCIESRGHFNWDNNIYKNKYLNRQSIFNMTYKPHTQQQRHTSWVIFQTQHTGFWVYTGCPGRKGHNFGRVFFMLKYTDITQNTYIQSWTVTEIMDKEKCGLLAGPRTVPASWKSYQCPSLSVVSYYRNCALAAYVLPSGWRQLWAFMSCIVLGTLNDKYDMSASVFVVQFNGFMSLTS
jgi:hypothetical protein